MRIILLIVIALLTVPSMASALSKHEMDIQEINAALPHAKITRAQRAQVIKLRDQGQRLHYAHKHGKAEVVLEKAKAILHIH
jgi:hypothetical protein